MRLLHPFLQETQECNNELLPIRDILIKAPTIVKQTE